jgi:hypothetical protein
MRPCVDESHQPETSRMHWELNGAIFLGPDTSQRTQGYVWTFILGWQGDESVEQGHWFLSVRRIRSRVLIVGLDNLQGVKPAGSVVFPPVPARAGIFPAVD